MELRMDPVDRVQRLRELATLVLDRREMLEAFGAGEFYLRCAVMVGRVQHYFLREMPYWRVALSNEVEELLQLYQELGLNDECWHQYLKDARRDIQWSARSIASDGAPWRSFPMVDQYVEWPNMLHPDTMSYLYWLGRTFEGRGDVVELGCWLGGGTRCLALGLMGNRRYRTLRVFDSFKWSAYMSDMGRGLGFAELELREGDSFQHLFEGHCSGIPADLLAVTAATLPDGRQAIELLDGASIGVVIFDMSQDFELTSQLWDLFSSRFVSGETVVVFQQYGAARGQDLRRFCQVHAFELQPLHKPEGSATAFLFRHAT
jgi:hypothetical protein